MRPMILIAALLAASPAHAAMCPALLTKATPATRAADAALIRKLAHQNVRASGIGEVLSDGKWRVIWATPENAENGVYFFRRGAKAWRYVDVWGGVVAPGEKPGVLSWARKLGAPPAIARCFADTAAAEE